MKCSFSLSWLGLLALLALVPAARATTVIAPDFDSLVGKSDYIVRAVVKSVTAEWRDNPEQPGHRYIASLVVLDVKETIKGTPPSPLILDLVGGRIGDQELFVEGAPKFAAGQEAVLFVKGNGRQVIPLVGMMHGHYPVRRDKLTGRDQVMRSDGQALYSEKEIGQEDSAPAARAVRDSSALPLTAADFAARIRQSPKFLNRDNLQ